MQPVSYSSDWLVPEAQRLTCPHVDWQFGTMSCSLPRVKVNCLEHVLDSSKTLSEATLPTDSIAPALGAGATGVYPAKNTGLLQGVSRGAA